MRLSIWAKPISSKLGAKPAGNASDMAAARCGTLFDSGTCGCKGDSSCGNEGAERTENWAAKPGQDGGCSDAGAGVSSKGAQDVQPFDAESCVAL